MPGQIPYGDREYVLVRTLKHDFLAGTGLYEALDAGAQRPRRLICKANRTMHFCFIPLRWLGRVTTAREVRNLRRCEGVDGVPRVLARIGPTAYIYEYIEGRTLDQAPTVAPDFFERLLIVLREIHARGLVHFDLHKRGNILVGDDGRPWIIDFQLCARIGDRLLLSRRLSTLLRRRLQAYDIYHLYKHKRRLLPARLTDAEAALSMNDSLPLRVHRAIAGPLKQLRRACLRFMHARGIITGTQGAALHAETDPTRWTRESR